MSACITPLMHTGRGNQRGAASYPEVNIYLNSLKINLSVLSSFVFCHPIACNIQYTPCRAISVPGKKAHVYSRPGNRQHVFAERV